MVLFLRGPQKRSGLIRYGSGKDMEFISELSDFDGSDHKISVIMKVEECFVILSIVKINTSHIKSEQITN